MMMKVAIFACLFFASAPSFADPNTAPILAPAATSEAFSRFPKKEDFYVSDFTTFSGPNISNLNSYTVDREGKTSKQPMYFDNEITAAYLINREGIIGIGPTVRFNYSPVLGKGFEWNDVGIKFIDYRAYQSKHLRAAFNLFVLAPTAAWSQAAGMKYSLKTTPYFWYEIPDTKFVVGSWSEVKSYMGVNYGTQVKFVYLPYINYKLNRKLSLNLLYEEEYHHDKGMTGPSFKLHKRDIQPGVVYNVSHNLSINPYLQIFLANRITTDRMGLGALISARIL